MKLLFTSMTFLFLFLPIILLIFYISQDRYKNFILLLFSLFFYAWGEPKYVFLMLFSIVLNYVLALAISYFQEQEKRKLSSFVFVITIICNVGMLFIFKYFNFVVNNMNSIFHLNINLKNIILPIGISFYTFQVLSYVIDVYKKEVKVQKNIVILGTYIALFPQLIAGPIVRYSTIEEELRYKKFSVDKFYEGLKRFIIGLGKKIIISNNVAFIADTILDSSQLSDYGSIIAMIGIISYTMQIYFDFSGYSDMAIGLGKMFGFEFLENFNYPYISKSITEFWHRWHISLSTWFRDYVYIPLGGNRVKQTRWLFNILIVWLLTGLWHGASWNFVIWGVYYGLVLLIEKLLLSKYLKRLPKFLQWFYAFILINLGWVIFRIESIHEIGNVLSTAMNFGKNNILLFIRENYLLINYFPYLILAFILATPMAKNIYEKLKSKNLFYNFCFDLLILGIFIISVSFIITSSYNPFIYFRF